MRGKQEKFRHGMQNNNVTDTLLIQTLNTYDANWQLEQTTPTLTTHSTTQPKKLINIHHVTASQRLPSSATILAFIPI
jgi:hypothetical protein